MPWALPTARLWGERARARPVSDGDRTGWVVCPLRGPRPADECATCFWVRQAHLSGDPPEVHCTPTGGAVLRNASTLVP